MQIIYWIAFVSELFRLIISKTGKEKKEMDVTTQTSEKQFKCPVAAYSAELKQKRRNKNG